MHFEDQEIWDRYVKSISQGNEISKIKVQSGKTIQLEPWGTVCIFIVNRDQVTDLKCSLDM